MTEVSTLKVIKNDFGALLLTIGGPICLLISGFAAYFGFLPEVRGRGGGDVDLRYALAFFAVAAVLTAFLFSLLAKRISGLKRILQSGPRTTATVTAIGFVKDRGRVEFKYSHQGREHDTGAAIMKNKETTALVAGSEVEVAIDPAKPTRALIVQLFAR